MSNKSGVTPLGDRVLVKPDVIEEMTSGGIIIAQPDRERHQAAQWSGTLVAVGPDAWKDRVTIVERWIDGGWKPAERRTTGYSAPFAKVGDRISFAQWNGKNFEGMDGEQYRLLNDEDLMGGIDDKVDFTEMRSREPLSKQ